MSEPKPTLKMPGTGLWAAIMLLAAFWPVLMWWGRRLVDDSDEPLGVLALVCALFFLWRERTSLRVSRASLVVALSLAVAARLLADRLPMLALGLLLVTALVVALRLWRLPGVAVLLSLALPWVATLQFLLSYPLRVVVATTAGGLLSLFGVEVTREGTDLWHQGMAVGVDAPCSGLRMLWFLLFAAAFLTARFRLDWPRALFCLALGGVLALLANILRATVLFFPEAGLVSWPLWTHEATGLLFFAPALIALLLCTRRLERKAASESRMMVSMPSTGWVRAFCAVAVILSLSWFLRAEAPVTKPLAQSAVEWPDQFRGLALTPLPLSMREEHFASGFPGALARFRCGEGEVIFRRVDRATRMLHPAEDCFKAAGFEMRRLSASVVAEDGLWQVWEARRGDDPALWVCEQIRAANGDLFTDVSAWYWQALRHPENGPWTAVTWVRFAHENAP